MKTLTTNGFEYTNIFVDGNKLIKKTNLSKEKWEYISKFHFDFLVNPIKIENNFITMPYLTYFKNLNNLNYKLNDKKIIILLIKTLKYLLLLHKNNIVHADIFSLNIMIDEVFKIKLIDFDYSIINNQIPEDNIYIYDGLDDETIINLTKRDDVKDTLLTYLYYIKNKQFIPDIVNQFNIDSLNLNYDLKIKINDFFENKLDIPEDYFITDLAKELTK